MAELVIHAPRVDKPPVGNLVFAGMGTWDEGVLDNDTSQDGIGDISAGVREDVLALASEESNPETVARLAASIGVLLQLSAFDFSPDSDRQDDVLAVLRKHSANFDVLPASAASILRRIVDGEAVALSERPGEMSQPLCEALRTGAARCQFGLREASLFETAEGPRYVQQVVDRCIAVLIEEFEDEDVWSDLCRECSAMGPLCALLVLEPATISRALVTEWRMKAADGLQQLIAAEDEELGFQRPYYANVDLCFEGLLALSGAA